MTKASARFLYTPLTSKCLFVNLLIVRSVLLSQSQKNLFLRRHIFTHFISHEKKIHLFTAAAVQIYPYRESTNLSKQNYADPTTFFSSICLLQEHISKLYPAHEKTSSHLNLTPPQPCHSKHASAHMSNDYNLSQLDNSTVYIWAFIIVVLFMNICIEKQCRKLCKSVRHQIFLYAHFYTIIYQLFPSHLTLPVHLKKLTRQLNETCSKKNQQPRDY